MASEMRERFTEIGYDGFMDLIDESEALGLELHDVFPSNYGTLLQTPLENLREFDFTRIGSEISSCHIIVRVTFSHRGRSLS